MEQINIGYDWEIGHFTIINNVNLPTSILLSMAILFIYIYIVIWCILHLQYNYTLICRNAHVNKHIYMSMCNMCH